MLVYTCRCGSMSVIKGTSPKVTWYSCPQCGKRYRLIDDNGERVLDGEQFELSILPDSTAITFTFGK